MDREKVLQEAHTAIKQRVSRDSLRSLQNAAIQYGTQKGVLPKVENWLGELEEKDFAKLSQTETAEWLKDWLHRLP
ncbi:hypothetical protein [Oscillatoria acuminata]|uniref:Uncharacterized protein n=1 Tax=Oscillatoria acuminata PCC 6304 TaxID=56110 RepID=K9TLS8_9CYAN|nr:hypothetical protein [Oscillatoria acuminata]AFY83368.1 hypothetical protein Oscil6304_3813 [Oscillatoria acuminata PCC 6304]